MNKGEFLISSVLLYQNSTPRTHPSPNHPILTTPTIASCSFSSLKTYIHYRGFLLLTKQSQVHSSLAGCLSNLSHCCFPHGLFPIHWPTCAPSQLWVVLKNTKMQIPIEIPAAHSKRPLPFCSFVYECPSFSSYTHLRFTVPVLCCLTHPHPQHCLSSVTHSSLQHYHRHNTQW